MDNFNDKFFASFRLGEFEQCLIHICFFQSLIVLYFFLDLRIAYLGFGICDIIGI